MTYAQTIAIGTSLTRWFDHAACRHGATADFFDHQVRGGRPDREAYRVARAYCDACPVMHSCRREAEKRGEVGVWGGQLRAGAGDSLRTYDLLPAKIGHDARRRRRAS